MKVRDLLTDESKWTKGASARNAKGEVVDVRAPDACCWCLKGAVYKCYPWETVYDINAKVYSFARMNHIRLNYISEWNDARRRTFADVRKLIEELDI